MDKFPRELLEGIRSQHNLVEWVSKSVDLRPIGDDHVGSCPFHEDSTPSFRVNRRRYICFGCRSKGDIISWVQHAEGLSFPDAVRKLSDGVEPLPSEPKREAPLCTPYDAPLVRRIIEINHRLEALFFEGAKRSQVALDYISKRGGLDNFGYCHTGGFEIANSVIGDGVTYDDLILTGAFGQTSDGSVYCRLWGRMVIPLRNRAGHILGFSGRIIPGIHCGEGPKYLDPKTTPAFSKKRYIFGLDKLQTHEPLWIVEGQIDCLKMQAIGKNCCATNTAHISPEQINILRDITSSLVVAYDGDMPGIEGSLRAYKALVNAGCHVLGVFIFPDGKDPDEWIASGCESGYYFEPSFPQLAGEFMNGRYKMDRLQELVKPWVEANIKEGYPHYNIIDYCMQAYPQFSKEIKDAVLLMKDNCKEVNGWMVPQDEDIKRLIKAWIKPCREVRLNGKTKQR